MTQLGTTLPKRAVGAWRRWPALRDAALAGILLAVCVVVTPPSLIATGLVDRAANDGWGGQVLLWWAVTAVTVMAVALRRSAPLPMLAVCTLATAIHLGLGAPFLIIDLGLAVLLYTVAVRYRRRLSLTALISLLLLVAGWGLYSVVASYFLVASGRPAPAAVDLIPPVNLNLPPVNPSPPARGEPPARSPTAVAIQNAGTGLVLLGSILVASWATGSSARSRRAYLDELRARAHDLERERDQQAALAVASERARISRELHDIVAHGLSVMVTQAQGADAALDKRLDDARTALAAVIKTGRDSLADMRRVLARTEGVDDAWHPPPGLGQIPALIRQVTAAGTQVRLHIDGIPVPLPSTVDLSAYRIVQEALTNTMKHAGPGATATVNVEYKKMKLDIEISDNGRGMTSNGSRGNGLRGMRERIRLLGGQLTTGPTPAGGFAVHATLPLQETDT